MGRFGAAALATALMLAGAGASAAQPKAPPRCAVGVAAELPVVMDGNQPMVRGSINGKAMLALLDTGAFRTMIWRDAAERYGLRPVPVRGWTVYGVGGRQSAMAATVDDLKLGTSGRRGMRFLVVDGAGTFRRPEVALILGQDVLGQYDLEVDLANSMVRMIKAQGDCRNVPLAYWAQAYDEATLRSRTNETEHAVANGRLNGKPLRIMLDTGASTSVLTLGAAAKAGVSTDDPRVTESGISAGAGKRSLRSWVGTFDSFELGTQTIKNAKLRMANLFGASRETSTGSHIATAAVDSEMLLGADFFRSHRVLIAYSQNKVYFTHNGGPVFQVTGPLMADEEPQAASAEAGS